MPTKQRIVWGSKTEWGETEGALENLPEAKGLAVPETQTEYQDVTNLDSEGGFREFIPGLKDAGEITIPCGYTSAAYAQAVEWQRLGKLIHFRTTLPKEEGQSAGDVFTFKGYVTPAMETNDVGDPIALNINIRTSGAVTYAQGAAA